jgi:hypothetical protein
VGVALFSANLAVAAFMVALFRRSEAQINQRIDRLEDRMDRGSEQLRTEMNQGFAQLRVEMNQGFARQDDRIRRLEQGQAYMSGQFSELKDYFVHRPSEQDSPDTGDQSTSLSSS